MYVFTYLLHAQIPLRDINISILRFCLPMWQQWDRVDNETRMVRQILNSCHLTAIYKTIELFN